MARSTSTAIDLLELNDEEMRRVRLARIALVAQGAMNSLNPGQADQGADRPRAARSRRGDRTTGLLDQFLTELLERVGLRPGVANMFPHELSGGMKQRVCIAMAISLQPQVIVADEPTSALDVVMQWQVIDTLRRVQQELGAAVIQIGHDMGLMAHSVDRIGVMYAGKLVEVAHVRDLFREPLHPYTQMLIASLPSLEDRNRLQAIGGSPPSLLNPPAGCPFHPRCPYAMDRCKVVMPPLREIRPRHLAACHLYEPT